MNKLSECIEYRCDDGVVLHIDPKDDERRFPTVYDIEVPEGMRELNIGSWAAKVVNLTESNFLILDIKGVDKCFESVEVLYVNDSVYKILIDNRQFPNVALVAHHKDDLVNLGLYTEGKMLIKGNTLYNTFRKGPGEVIDLSGVYKIAPQAFEGCEVVDVIHFNALSANISKDAFANSKYEEVLKKEGKIVFDDVIVAIDGDTLFLEDKYYQMTRNIVNEVNTVVMDTMTYSIKRTLSFIYAVSKSNDVRYVFRSHIGQEALQMIHEIDKVLSFELPDDDPNYTSVDGVIYTKDMKSLVAYPSCKNKGGKFCIPEGVQSIGALAFHHACVNEIIMPDSVTYIGRCAFDMCKAEKIRLSNNLTYISDSVSDVYSGCFNRCGVKEIRIPKSLKYIGAGSFNGSSLKRVIFEEGSAEYIGEYAFMCGVKSVELPASCKFLKKGSLSGCENVKILSEKAPSGIIGAVIRFEDGFYSRTTARGCGRNVSICINNRKLILPSVLYDKDDFVYFVDCVDEGREVSVDRLHEIWDSLKSSSEKTEMAIELYKKYPDSEYKKKCRKYIASRAASIMVTQIRDELNDELKDFLELGVATPNAINKALDKANELGNVVASAYLLDYSQEHKPRSRFSMRI